jgi:hypothetical protein
MIFRTTALTAILLSTGSLFAQPSLGAPPDGKPAGILPRSRSTGGLTIDRTNRQEVANAFRNYYRKFIDARNGWTGSVTGCRSGQNSAQYDAATLEILKYYRAMAGVPADVEFAAKYNQAAQDAALIMEAKNSLNHNPPPSWPCFSESGKKGASSSNLCLGCVGPTAIDAYVDDRSVQGVGHRKWALAPGQKVLGTGSSARAHALYVFGDWRSDEEVAHIREVAWPPSGFVPHQFGLDPGYPWSYQRHDAGADLSAARMILSHNGRQISTRVDTANRVQLVVYPTGLPKPGRENEYNKATVKNGYRVDVRIENARIGGKLQTIEYSVNFIDAESVAISETDHSDNDSDVQTQDPADVARLSSEMLRACYEGNVALTKSLLARGANVNAANKGWTGLMYGAYFGHMEVVRLLIAKGADANIKLQGWTAAALARKKGYTQIAEFLEAKTQDRSLPQGLLPGSP